MSNTIIHLSVSNESSKFLTFDLKEGKDELFKLLIKHFPDMTYTQITTYIESKYDRLGRPVILE